MINHFLSIIEQNANSYLIILLYFHGFFAWMNIILTGLLWIFHKQKLFLYSCMIWIATLIAAYIESQTTASPFHIILGFSSVFLVNFAMTLFLAKWQSYRFYWYYGILLLGIGYALSYFCYQITTSFILAAIPAVIGIALPLWIMVIKIIKNKWKQLTFIQKNLMMIVIVYTLLFVGYPFARETPILALSGFSIGLFALFAFSIFTQAMILEKSEVEKNILELKEKNLRDLTHFITHEVKNTLYVVAGTAKLLQQNAITDEIDQQEALLNIQSSCEKLSDFSKRFLYFETLATNQYPIQLKQIKLMDSVSAAIELNHCLINTKKIKIENEISETLQLTGDSEMLTILFSNLLNNAAKFSKEKNRIHISAKQIKNEIKIQIQDTGSGISEEILKKLQNNNIQPTKTQDTISTGLGTAICHQIVKYHQGKMLLTSKVNQGTMVEMTLPQKPIQVDTKARQSTITITSQPKNQ